jgi:hypothetical protein
MNNRFLIACASLCLVCEILADDGQSPCTYTGFKAVAAEPDVHDLKSKPNGGFYGTVTMPRLFEPGWYHLTVPYRTDGDWEAQFAAYLKTTDSPAKSLTPWQHISASREWSMFHLVVKLDAQVTPRLIFNHSQKQGDMTRIQVKALDWHPFDPVSAKNWFLNNGQFQGGNGALPISWTHYKAMSQQDNGMTDAFGFEGAPRVFKVGGTAGKSGQITSTHFPFPNDGKLEFSIWGRSLDTPTTIRVFMLGDQYKWNVNQRFQLNSSWQKCTIRGTVPETIEKSPFFWCRIDIEKGRQVLLGKVELKQLETKKNVGIFDNYPANLTLSENLLTNPEFELGYWGWNQYSFSGGRSVDTAKQFLNRRQPELRPAGDERGQAMRCEPLTALTSMCFPLQTGKTYTISADLKCAMPGQAAGCRMFLLDSRWKSKSKTFSLTDQWQRVSFTADWEFSSRRGNAYLRLDVKENPILMDRLQVVQGTRTSFTAPPVQLGLVTSAQQTATIFDASDRQATMILKGVCRPPLSGELTLKVDVTDAWGKPVWHHEVKAQATPTMTIPLRVNRDGHRGVFHVTLTAFDRHGKLVGAGESRYAVCRNLAGQNLPDNPIAGHLEMFKTVPTEADRLLPLLGQYLPINGYNRCFCALDSQQIGDAALVAQYRDAFEKHWTWSPAVKRIMVMGGIFDRQGNYPWAADFLSSSTVSADVMAKYLDHVKVHVNAFKGIVDGWELFNEPHLWRLRKGPDKGKAVMAPEKVAQLYKAAYPVIKHLDPSCLVVGPCSGGTTYKDWMMRFLKAGGASYVDVLSFHGYCDSPDLNDTYGYITQMSRMLKKAGRQNLPIWNTEQYYGARIPTIRHSEKEFYRHYFRDREIETAAVTVANLIHHAAVGSRQAMFGFHNVTLSGFEKEYFLMDFVAAGNAAAEMLGTAGKGKAVGLGSAIKCFLFPDAQGGPLATVHTVNSNSSGTVMLPKQVRAFDMMGNPLSGGTIAISHTPVYLRFPAETATKQATDLLRQADFLGLGDPFNLGIALTNKNTLAVTIANRLNRTAAGSVILQECPVGWQFERKRLDFADLGAGETTILNFRVTRSTLEQLVPLHFKFGFKTPKQFFSKSVDISAMFATQLPEIRGDGTLDSWERAEWITLGKNHTSKKFHPALDWTGPADLTAKMACGWNQNGLGIAIVVSDDQFNFPNTPRQNWGHDSVQLYFDMKNDATPESAAQKTNAGDDARYQIGYVNGKTAAAYLEQGPAGRYIGDANLQEGLDRDVKVTCRKLAPNQLFYDIFLPRATLPMVTFRKGASLGFSLLVNDNDGQGRKTGLTLAPKGKEPYNASHEYRDLILLP